MYNKILPTDFQSEKFIAFRVGDYWITERTDEWDYFDMPNDNEISLKEYTNYMWDKYLTSNLDYAIKFNYDEKITTIKDSFWLPKYFPDHTYHGIYQTFKDITLKEVKWYLEDLFQHEVNIIYYTKTVKTSYNIHSMDIVPLI